MLRYIIKRSHFDAISELRDHSYITTTDAASVERFLREGGHGPSGHLLYELVGIEVFDEERDGAGAKR